MTTQYLVLSTAHCSLLPRQTRPPIPYSRLRAPRSLLPAPSGSASACSAACRARRGSGSSPAGVSGPTNRSTISPTAPALAARSSCGWPARGHLARFKAIAGIRSGTRWRKTPRRCRCSTRPGQEAKRTELVASDAANAADSGRRSPGRLPRDGPFAAGASAAILARRVGKSSRDSGQRTATMA